MHHRYILYYFCINIPNFIIAHLGYFAFLHILKFQFFSSNLLFSLLYCFFLLNVSLFHCIFLHVYLLLFLSHHFVHSVFHTNDNFLLHHMQHGMHLLNDFYHFHEYLSYYREKTYFLYFSLIL